ncbi:enolase-phosphatase E1 [Coemansia sp. RSA 2618]|nr:enolase-phosphatase E1 [Coemansia sp. RSA 2618]
MPAPAYDVVLLDIEGTTTPISFVHDVLFPYITANVRQFLESRWDDSGVQHHVRAIAEQANADVEAGITSAVGINLGTDSPAEVQRKVLANVEWQMAADRKVGALKGLQGYMWRFGYESGELQGVMFSDAVDAIRRWVREGRRVFIYSSGSVEAQKLIFGFSDHGDLLGYIAGHYDTRVGAKVESGSYAAIASDIGASPERILFVSDSIREIQAADEAGLQAVLSVRPGNVPVNKTSKLDKIGESGIVKKSGRKKITAKEKRQLKIYDIPEEARRFELFLPLHRLWSKYISSLLGDNDITGLIADSKQQQQLFGRLIKADLHGAKLAVERSKCPNFVGISGIVAQETKNAFKIITEDDRLVVVPKARCVFALQLPSNDQCLIYGDQFMYRASERASKKFKAKPTVDL